LQSDFLTYHTRNNKVSKALVAHAYNPRYSGGRDKEDRNLKQAQANSSVKPLSQKKPSQRAGGSQASVIHGCNPSNSGAKTGMLEIRCQPRQIVCKTLPQKYPSQKKMGGWWSGSR
jgi:hypothetical protein